MNLHGLSPKEVQQYWQYIEPLLSKPFTRMEIIKDYDTDYVYDQLMENRMQCWISHENEKLTAVFITQINIFPKRKVLSIPYVGAVNGTIDTWIDAIEVFKDFAKANDCGAVRGWGRKGWERVLKPDSVRIEFDIEV